MTTYKFAGFWRRFVAYTIDNIIINFIFITLTIVITTAYVLGSMSGNSRTWLTDLTDLERVTSVTLGIGIIYILISIAYFTYFHGINGRTPGKMLLGLQVLSADGTSINFGVSFLRAVGYLVSSLLFTIPLGFIWAAFDKRKQGWHDKIAGTVVIIRPDETEAAAGLTIPETHPGPQSEEGHGETAMGESRATADQPAVDEQKTP